MTPSIDERREAAQRLRKLAVYVYDSESVLDLFAEAMGVHELRGTDELFSGLADLIEPLPERSCRNTAGEPFAGYREFGCSECGAHLEVDGDTDANLLVGGDRPMPNYCPNCGAKVVER